MAVFFNVNASKPSDHSSMLFVLLAKEIKTLTRFTGLKAGAP
jgi:hypothetical protein